jgi:transposase-like protein
LPVNEVPRETVTQAARSLGVPRTTLHGWVRQLLQRFEEAGLGDYLEKRPSTRERTG